MNAEFECISVDHESRINNILDEFNEMDIFFQPKYLRLFEEYGYGKPFYLHYRSNNGFIIDPVFIRKLQGEEDIIDLYSPWTYGGPILLFEDEHLIKKNLKRFLSMKHEFCTKNKIITEFQRFHPFMTNKFIKHFPKENVFFEKNIVFLDLNTDKDLIINNYSRKIRKGIRIGNESGLKFKRGSDLKNDITVFRKLYEKRMEELNTSDFYRFNENFYQNLVENFDEELNIFFIYMDEEVIGAKLLLGHNSFLNGYIGCCDPEFNHLRTNDLFEHEINMWAKRKGFRYYVTGGGRTNSISDGTYRYKIQLTNNFVKQYCIKIIHDKEKYRDFCELKGVDNISYDNAIFFPEYRKPK